MSLDVRIKKSFGDYTLDVAFAAGNEALGFLGASGCGKSLTLRCIAGIETPDAGRIVVNGKVFFDSEQKINLTPQQRKTALLFQNYMLFPNLTVADNIGAGIGREVPKAERERIISEELERFGLRGFGQRYPAQLSGGQQQRVALARMLAARPGILMLDEPFSALDSHLKGVLEQNLVSLFDAFEGTILYVSHDIDESLRFCDRIAVVDAGRIVEMDRGRELVDRPQSMAGLKLSGCKNAPAAEYAGEHMVHVPPWGIDVHTTQEVPRDVKCLGLRAFYVERAEGPRRELLSRPRRPRERCPLRAYGASGLSRSRRRGWRRRRLRGERDELSAPAHVLAREHARRRCVAGGGGEAVGAHPSGQGVSGESITLFIKKCEQKRR